jgi:SAM-dependent methyltransferase
MGAIRDAAKRVPGANRIYHWVRGLYIYFRYNDSNGEGYFCPLCNHTAKEFLVVNQIFQRKNAKCPFCGSLERLRLEYLYLLTTDIFTERNKLLHFAPEAPLVKALKNNYNLEYYGCDIQPGRAEYIVDVTDICFSAESFDYIIINHVLEHIPDDGKALAEIWRVLKPGGKAIITVPIDTRLGKTLEKSTDSDEERTRLFGQRDHVRLYGSDFAEKLRKSGFNVESYSTNKDVSSEAVKRYALFAELPPQADSLFWDLGSVYIAERPVEGD